MANHRMKQDATADLQFRLNLENLLHNHLDDCITCSSTAAGDEEESTFSSSDHHRQFTNDDAETSARHSRILSSWVARQAEEMITTIERRNRESELMALARLHTVSTLDPSFLRESRSQTSVERPNTETRSSRILQVWRELEDISRGIRRSDNVSESDGTSYMDEDLRSSREGSPDQERVREIVNRISETASNESSRNNRSEVLGETERERVRLVREWVQMVSNQRDGRREREEGRERRSRRRERENGRDGSVTENEEQPEHVRRELLRIRGRQARLELIRRMAREREIELQGLEEHRAVSDFAHRNRIQALLRGRFLRNGTPPENERPPSVAAREIGQLRQRRPVSGLRDAFRSRLENIVRGQASSQAEISTFNNATSNIRSEDSSHANNNNSPTTEQYVLITPLEPSDVTEESQLRSENSDDHQNIQTDTTPGFESSFENSGFDWQESVTQGVTSEHETREREWQQLTSDWHDDAGEESETNWDENINHEWTNVIAEDHDVDDDTHLQEAEQWHENQSNETLEMWEGPSEPSGEQHNVPTRRVNRFIPPEDDNVYSMELRELLSRRSVSNLLSSGFRESLDRLIQSYVQRQVHSPLDWDHQGSVPSPASPEEDIVQREDTTGDQLDSSVRSPPIRPPPPAPPRQPLWHSDLHHSTWSRQSMNRSESEWDAIHELRADMARLQQGMSHMQRMLEACMDMQLELQRSVRQEVSAALNRSPNKQGTVDDFSDDGSKWSQVRKGTCCICCDTHIDALLYRCGHMCTCSKCANELVRNGGKCPLCRAPILEVIRAYSIQ